METLVLNTLGNDYTEQIKALIKDKEVEIVDTSDMKIVHCMGCLIAGTGWHVRSSV